MLLSNGKPGNQGDSCYESRKMFIFLCLELAGLWGTRVESFYEWCIYCEMLIEFFYRIYEVISDKWYYGKEAFI